MPWPGFGIRRQAAWSGRRLLETANRGWLGPVNLCPTVVPQAVTVLQRWAKPRRVTGYTDPPSSTGGIKEGREGPSGWETCPGPCLSLQMTPLPRLIKGLAQSQASCPFRRVCLRVQQHPLAQGPAPTGRSWASSVGLCCRAGSGRTSREGQFQSSPPIWMGN